MAIKVYSRLNSVLMNRLNNEKGAQTLEWIAVGAVVVTIAAFLANAFGDGKGIEEVVDKILDKVKKSAE